MSFFSEFKAFAMRGNVIDLAVAVVIGAAFGKITASLVDGIIMPVIGVIVGGVNITDKTVVIGQATIKWGLFLQSLIDFTIIAFAIFCLPKVVNRFNAKQPETPPPPAPEIQLLTEIRDLLKK